MGDRVTVGIFGGTFDPPHNGHLELCELISRSGLVDKLIVVPCLVHAFGKDPAPFEHRVAMCELMVGTMPDVSVSEAEAALDEPGKTLLLVQYLSSTNPGVDFRLVAGSDIYHEREKWYQFDAVARLAPPIYVAREGVPPIAEPTLEAPVGVSSTEVRDALAGKVVPRNMLPDAVADYIVANGLYGLG